MEEKTLFRSFFDECWCLPAYLRWEALERVLKLLSDRCASQFVGDLYRMKGA